MFMTVKLIIICLESAITINETGFSQKKEGDINKIIPSTLNNTTKINDRSSNYFWPEPMDNGTDSLDWSILDTQTQNKVLSAARAQDAKLTYVQTNENLNDVKQMGLNADNPNNYFINKTIDLMKQSVYSTRYRLQDTREIRMKYSDDVSYKIALMYGSLMQLRLKLDNIYATLMKFPYTYKFIHFLVLYERCVAIHVDITFLVERIFMEADNVRKAFEVNEMDEENPVKYGMQG